MDSVVSLNNKGVAAAEALHALGIHAVQAAYSNKDAEHAEYLINNIPQFMRKPLASWMKRAGLNVNAPIVGSASWAVTGILDSKKQKKAFDFIKETPVIEVDEVATKAKKVKPVIDEADGADKRAQAHAAKLIKRLRDGVGDNGDGADAHAAAWLNDALNAQAKLQAALARIAELESKYEVVELPQLKAA
jgi:hypothetical protein